MALVAETGAGIASAESYVSVADADSYFAKLGNETWIDLDEDVKEIALRKATRYMLAMYRGSWHGYRLNETQALDWPRQGVPVDDVYAAWYGGAYVPDNIVPAAIKEACCELAWRTQSATLWPDEGRDKRSVSVGPVTVVYDDASPQRPRFPEVEAMLRPYLRMVGVMHMIER